MSANERTSKTEIQPKRVIAAGVAIVIGLIVALLAISCTSAAPTGDAGAIDASSFGNSKESGNYPEDERNDAEPVSDEAVEGDGANDNMPAVQIAYGQSSTQSSHQDFSTAGSTPKAPSSGSEAPSSNLAPAQPQKTWVEDTERVWVIDKDAWTENVPVYGTVEVSICNICGTDITGNTSAHAKEHMKAGEGSGHHSEVRQKIIGYNTVSHPEEGHWEKRVVGGHWE